MSLLHTHQVFVTKYRRPVFTDAKLTFYEHTMHAVHAELDVEGSVQRRNRPRHLLVAYPPTLATSTLAQRLKGRTAYTLRPAYTGRCFHARMRGHLWSPTYFAVSSAGAPLSNIKQAPATTGWGSPQTDVRGLRPRLR